MMTFLYLHWQVSLNVHIHKPNNFVVDFPLPIKLEGEWVVELTDFKIKGSIKEPVYVLSDICEDSYVCCTLLPVLRCLDTKSNSFSSSQFIKVNTQEVQSIKIYIKGSFLKEIEVLYFH